MQSSVFKRYLPICESRTDITPQHQLDWRHSIPNFADDSDTNDRMQSSNNCSCGEDKSVDFNYHDVASEDDLRDHDDSIVDNTSQSTSTNFDVYDTLVYFNSVIDNATREEMEDSTEQCTSLAEDKCYRYALRPELINQIYKFYDSVMNEYIFKSGHTGLLKYSMVERIEITCTVYLPTYLLSANQWVKRDLELDESLRDLPVSPVFRNYQLLGDSQMLRFSESVLSMRRWRSRTRDNRNRIGYCVSGQCISELADRVRAAECRLNSEVVVLIGTNDLRRDCDVMVILEGISELVGLLEKRCKRIVLLTVPPLPLLQRQDTLLHMEKVKIVNKYIKDLANNDTITVLDLCSLFISFDNTICEEYYEQYIRGRDDLVHLNKNGFKMLRTLLDCQYFDNLKD